MSKKYTITRGDYQNTTDNNFRRYYIQAIDDAAVNRIGSGYRTRQLAKNAIAALESGLDWLAMPRN